MKRNLLILALALVLVFALALTGCEKDCEHEWKDATCDAPKTCKLCEATEGSPLGHSWKAATCAAPKTCENCGKVEGKTLEHTWSDATCAAPKTCTGCGATDGEKTTEHTWTDATCAAPKTCSVCKITEGEALAHEWVEADCENAKTCSGCAATEGAPLGHTWNAATCDDPKTCETCSKTEGDALGHTWTNATCAAPKTCSACKKTEGKALGHKWVEATTEAPKTCSVCKATEGTKIKTDSRFTTAACKPLFGSWTTETVITSEDLGMEFEGQVVEVTTCTFKNDGTLVVESGVKDFDEYKAFMKVFTVELMYASFAESGMTKDQADDAFMLTYNMTIQQYVDQEIDAMRESDVSASQNCVYYVKDGAIYGGDSWDDELLPISYTLSGNKLILTDDETGETMEFTRK